MARIPVSTFRYQRIREPRTSLRLCIRKIAPARVRYSYRNIRVLLKREGWQVARERKLESNLSLFRRLENSLLYLEKALRKERPGRPSGSLTETPSNPVSHSWHLSDLRISHRHIPPGCPQVNGKVERRHKTDSEEFYRGRNFRHKQDLARRFKRWEREYNCDLMTKSRNMGHTPPSSAFLESSEVVFSHQTVCQ